MQNIQPDSIAPIITMLSKALLGACILTVSFILTVVLAQLPNLNPGVAEILSITEFIPILKFWTGYLSPTILITLIIVGYSTIPLIISKIRKTAPKNTEEPSFAEVAGDSILIGATSFGMTFLAFMGIALFAPPEEAAEQITSALCNITISIAYPYLMPIWIYACHYIRCRMQNKPYGDQP